jgi:hypothetical protein
MQLFADGQQDIQTERSDFLFRFLSEDFDPDKIAIRDIQPGRHLLLRLPGPISCSRFNASGPARLSGQSFDAPLHPPQQAQRVDEASRRGCPAA